jgi:NAD(P)-dependent dehydrogenase (short-subunit alcohol dehydrogenase family)
VESASKSALVTGGATGLGAAIARRLARDGYRCVIVDIDEAAAREQAEALPHGVAFATDVTDEAAVETMLDALDAVPDVLVNNAGIVRFGPLLDHRIEDFRKVIDVNLIGTFIMSRAVGRRMIRRGSGAIVNITSLNAVAPSPDAGAYPASKAAVALLTQHFALVLGPHGIRVNAVAPGFIDAGMGAAIYADAEVRATRSRSVPVGSIGTADDVAEAVAFLASDRARYTTGHQLMVDGGVSFSIKNQLPRKAPPVRT